MDQEFHDQIDALVNQMQIRLHQELDEALAWDVPGVLLTLERTLLDLLLGLGSALIAVFLCAVHRQSSRIREVQQHTRGQGYRNIGWRWTPITTLFGGRHMVWTRYAVVDRRGKPGRPRGVGKRGVKGSGRFPLLEVLGCRAGATPALLGEVSSQLAWGPSEAAAVRRLADRGIRLDPDTVRRLSYAIADEGLACREQALQEGRPAPGSEDIDLRDKRVVVTFDGGRVRTRSARKGRRRKNGYHGFETAWRMPRLLVIYGIDDQGRCLRHQRPLYDGIITSATQMFDLLRGHLQALHINQASQVIFIADGAPEHWDSLPQLIQDVGLQPAQVVQILDWAHAVEHLTTVADLCKGWSKKEREKWLKRQRTRLYRGQLQAVLNELYDLAKGRRAKAIHTEIAFFEKHALRMRYAFFRNAHVPIGSGAVESAIRRVVNLRMKGNGIFWLDENPQRMLFLRCQLLSLRWEDFLFALLFPTQTPNQPNEQPISWPLVA